MKWRWLCLIPKTEDSKTSEEHRPVMLVEVLRKCWIGLSIYKITQVWKKHDILDPSQHGYKSKRGTDTALLGLQIMFEQSARINSPLFLSSWDISKAFDSLSKNVLKFSWIRLGVPATSGFLGLSRRIRTYGGSYYTRQRILEQINTRDS